MKTASPGSKDTSAPRGEGPSPAARRLAVEGLLQSLGQSFSESYLTAFALMLGAGGPVLGLVSSLPTAVTALAQSMARRMQASRRGIVRAWSVQALAYAALSGCAFLPPTTALACLCLTVLVGWGAGGLAAPAWTRLVADAVPRAQIGWFFGLRSMSQQFGIVTAIVGGGLLLSALRTQGREALGFALLFLLAASARVGGTAVLSRVRIEVRPRARTRASGLEVLRGSLRFRRLALYLWSVQLATSVATPFFVPYMLADLGLSYLEVGLLLAVPATVKIGTVRAWGRVADRYGPGPLLRVAGWLVAPVPALWLIYPGVWCVFAAQFVAGFAWGAYDVAQASSLLQTTRGRANAVGVFNLVDGGSIVIGSLLGGVIVKLAHLWGGGSGYLAPMAVSAVLRMLAAATLLPRVRGIGHPDWPTSAIPFRIWAIRPSRGFTLRPWGRPLRPDSDDPVED